MRGRAHSALHWRTALLLAALLGLCHGTAGLQVFLTGLRLLSGSHRLRIEGGMTIYMRCDNTDINLPEVKEPGRPYAWAAEDKPLTTLTRGGCKRCGVFEDRRIPFIDDDVFGSPFELCEADFEASPSDDLRVTFAGHFEVTLHCPECAPLAPPPTPPPAPPAAAAAPSPAASPAHSPLTAVQASEQSALVRPGGSANASGGAGGGALPLAAIVGVAAAAAAVVGTVAGVALAVQCRKRRAAVAEQRARAFEAVFSDPELELEEVAAEDAKLFSWPRLGSRWARLRDTSVSASF